MTTKTNYILRPAIAKPLIHWFYDTYCSAGNLGKKFKQKIIKLAGIKNGDTVVDIGCGTGVLLIEAQKQFPQAKFIGFDPEQEASTIARKRMRRLSIPIVVLEDWAEELWIADNSVDVALSTLVLHHLPTDAKIESLKEMHRILKPGGKVIISDFGPGGWGLFLFEHRGYLKDHRLGLIPEFLKKSGFKNVSVIHKHSKKIDIIQGEK